VKIIGIVDKCSSQKKYWREYTCSLLEPIAKPLVFLAETRPIEDLQMESGKSEFKNWPLLTGILLEVGKFVGMVLYRRFSFFCPFIAEAAVQILVHTWCK